MRIISKEAVKNKKEYCCGKDVSASKKFINNMFICGEPFDKDKIVLCNKCYIEVLDGNDKN